MWKFRLTNLTKQPFGIIYITLVLKPEAQFELFFFFFFGTLVILSQQTCKSTYLLATPTAGTLFYLKPTAHTRSALTAESDKDSCQIK